MFDLIERNPGSWLRVASSDPAAEETTSIVRAQFWPQGVGDGSSAPLCRIVGAREDDTEGVLDWPQRPVDTVQLLTVRAADGRVLWSRDQPPEVDELIRAAAALDLLAGSLDHYTLCWTRDPARHISMRSAGATFNGAFRDGTPFHPDEETFGWHSPAFPDATTAINDVFDRRCGIKRS